MNFKESIKELKEKYLGKYKTPEDIKNNTEDYVKDFINFAKEISILEQNNKPTTSQIEEMVKEFWNTLKEKNESRKA